jgi:hypothetical protein
MSATIKARIIWIYPAVLIASWLAVRALAASPEAALSPAAVFTSAGAEIRDPSLKQLIARFAAVARASQHATP